MSNPLVEALAQMNLEPGRTYRYDVNGRQVIVEVLKELPVEAPPTDASDAMLDPWVELPAPEPLFVVQATPGELPPPDLPEIPTEDESP
ncbi:MAG TPA: hypothetical protein VMS17_01720 [Gemmataceae bacterium]|nr:hypothetical protein [Gemmataceae bacterium]